MEEQQEGGSRCFHCYELRLRNTFKYASKHQFEYVTTTLSVSPHKKARMLNQIGEYLSKEYDVPYLLSDFKKRGGYIKSITLSEEYHLYRQVYCGCMYSYGKIL